MKKKILLSLLDVVAGLFAGIAGYSILSHNANAGDWCIAVMCLAVIVARLYTIIKTGKDGEK